MLAIETNAIIEFSALLTASGVIGIGAMKVVHFFDKDKDQTEEIIEMKQEQKLLVKGVMACLDGLQQLGANHTVTSTKEEINAYITDQAHKTKG